MKSLQLRLGVGLLISLITGFFVLWWFAADSVRSLTEDAMAAHLEHDAESILAAVHTDASGSLTVDIAQIEPVFLQPDSGQYYRVTTQGRTLRSLSLGDKDFPVPALPLGSSKRFYRDGPKGQPLMIMAYGYRKQDRSMTVAVAEDLSPTLKLIKTFETRFTLVSGILLLILILVQILILRGGFRSLVRIQQQLRSLERGERTQIDTDVPYEVAALVREVNWLLKILDQRLQRSRHALADLAHALKTPLTVLQQLPREEALALHPEIRSVLQTQTGNMQKLMERVLKRARLAGSGPSVAKFDVRREIPALIHVLQSMYRDKNLSIDFVAPDNDILTIDREDLLELTGNLLDNACKWAKSRIKLSIQHQDGIRLTVEDDGPGVSEADLMRLMQRGTRLDEEVSGHGLGLAIAQWIAEQYRGRLTLRRSHELGGFCAEAELNAIERTD
jgi:signal transduction histidine kinase